MVSSSDGVRDVDRGWKRITSQLARWSRGKGPHVDVGIQGDAGAHDGGLTNASLAATHEFGTTDGKIPARPFIGHTVDTNQERYLRALDEITRKAIAGEEEELAGLGFFGEQVRSDILGTISDSPGESGGPLKKWADSTLAQKQTQGKGGDPVLWDTGQLRQSIRAKVHR